MNSFVNTKPQYSRTEIELLNSSLTDILNQEEIFNDYSAKLFIISSALYNMEIKSDKDLSPETVERLVKMMLDHYRLIKIKQIKELNQTLLNDKFERKEINEIIGRNDFESIRMVDTLEPNIAAPKGIRIHLAFLLTGLSIYVFAWTLVYKNKNVKNDKKD
jgi:hypothetical protein